MVLQPTGLPAAPTIPPQPQLSVNASQPQPPATPTQQEPLPTHTAVNQAGKEMTLASPTRSPAASHLGFIDLPDYMQKIYDYLLLDPDNGAARPLGGQWILCVREYVGFEKRMGFVVRLHEFLFSRYIY